MKSKIIFATLLLFILINLACVSAIDNQTEDIGALDDGAVSHDLLEVDTADNVYLQSESSNLTSNNLESNGDQVSDEILGEAPYSFKKLNDLISDAGDGRTVKLTHDYKYDPSSDSEWYKGVLIDKNLVIDGQGHTIDGSGQAEILFIEQITRPVTVTVKNVNFINAGGSDGSAVYFSGFQSEGIVENCNFTNNKGILSGAIHFSFMGTVTNCNFYNNTASSGGAIYSKGYLEVSKSTFVNNTATSKIDGGGAIFYGYLSYSDQHYADIVDCKFIDNYAECGGVVYTDSRVIMTNCEAINNRALNAGVIYASSSAVLINSTFKNNSAVSYGVVNSNQALTITQSTFIDNHADNDSAVLRCEFGGTIKHSTFINNTAGKSSAVGYILVHVTGNLDVTNCTFTNNTAKNDAGTLNVDGKGQFTDCKFIGNRASNVGGALKISSDGRITNCEFIDNHVNGSGGAILFEGAGVLTNCNFTDNSAAKGGAVYITGQGTIKKCTFISNSVEDEGGAVLLKSTGSSTNSKFIENTAEIGGAISVYNSLTLSGTEFENNAATTGVNNIALRGSAKLSISNSTPEKLGPFRVLNFEILSIQNNTPYGSDEIIAVKLISEGPKINNDTVFIQINNKNYTAEVSGGTATIFIDNLECGSYSCYIMDTNENYTKPQHHVEFSIVKKLLTFGVINPTNIVYGETENITVIADENVSDGNISVSLNNKIYSADLINGTATLTIPGLNADDYSGYLIYNGKNYYAEQEQIQFNVAKSDVSMDINVTNHTYGEVVGITVNLTADNGILNEGDVIFEVNNVKYIKSVVDGIVKLELSKLNTGNYTLEIYFNGGNNYNTKTTNKTFSVAKKMVSLTVKSENITYGDKEIITVDVVCEDGSLPEGMILLEIGNKRYVSVVDNETITFEIFKLDAGNYTCKVSYNGGNNYNASTEINIFSVAKKSAVLSVNYKNITCGDVLKVIVNVTSDNVPIDGGHVIIAINNQNYSVIVKNGSAVIAVPNLNVGTYDCNITYDSDNYINSEPIRFDVLKGNATISASAKSYVINYAGEYSVIVENVYGNALSGKEVTFTLDGKNIGSATTNSKGIATIKLSANVLKTAKSGNKNIVIKFNGDSNYYFATTIAKITINKEKTKLVAKNKNFKKAKKAKKYTVTLKNSKGKAVKNVKVTLKIKKKTYKAKTNAKGKATFKIKKLSKKGTFKAKIAFKGNAYYNKVTKTVKIKIK